MKVNVSFHDRINTVQGYGLDDSKMSNFCNNNNIYS